MSIKIIKRGIADTIQDQGRYGFQHLGIQANGCMDYLSAQLGNAIVQNPLDHPVIELYFPASSFCFTSSYTICITGANFVPLLNDKSIELNKAIQVAENDVLKFLKPIEGSVAYLAIQGKINTPKWLESQSYFSTTLQKDFEFDLRPNDQNNLYNHSLYADKLYAIPAHVFSSSPIRFIPGPAWNDLTADAIHKILSQVFHTTLQTNRMGYLLKGPLLELTKPNQYLSSAVTRGTLQLLPNGSLMVLMADHQTIGGYANLGQIILVDLPRFAQLKNDTAFHFSLTNVNTAHQLYQEIQQGFIHRPEL
ncbi:MAG: biotin-dependent carboxyltransferase family protein [Bacteroidetes bacterium]|nr:biotin-dependent carboxyltransferase family protein [Bacteroidota bacterium]